MQTFKSEHCHFYEKVEIHLKWNNLCCHKQCVKHCGHNEEKPAGSATKEHVENNYSTTVTTLL